MSDGGGFRWDDSGIPKKPVDDAAPDEPPVTKYPVPERPAAATPPPASWELPTQAFTPPPASWELPTQAFTPPAEPAAAATPDWDQPTEAYDFDRAELTPAVQEAQPTPEPQQTSAIDSLFGESQFKEYEASAFPVEGVSAPASVRPRVEHAPITRTQRILFGVAGGLVAVIILVAIFLLGRTMPGLIPEPEAAAPAPAATTAPVAAAPAVGPVAPGEHEWNELLGTECLEPFTSVWAETYTVVDCATPHSAQLAYRGIFADESFAPYPGIAELQARINLLCTSPASVNYAVAGGLSDIAVSASYAATEQQWDAGQRQYYCFLTRSSGEPITVSLANAPVADEAPVASIPSSDP